MHFLFFFFCVTLFFPGSVLCIAFLCGRLCFQGSAYFAVKFYMHFVNVRAEPRLSLSHSLLLPRGVHFPTFLCCGMFVGLIFTLLFL